MGRFNWSDKTPVYRTNSFKTETTAIYAFCTVNPCPSFAAPTTWEMAQDPDASATNTNCFMMEVVSLDAWFLCSGEDTFEPGTMCEIGFRSPGLDEDAQDYENYPTLNYGNTSSCAYHDLYRTFVNMSQTLPENTIAFHRQGNPLFEIPIGRTANPGTQTPEDYEYLFWATCEPGGTQPTWYCYVTLTWRMKGCNRQIKTSRELYGDYEAP